MSLIGELALPTGFGVNTPASVSTAILNALDGALSVVASSTRTLISRFQDRASVLDYPVPVDGVTPAAAALQAAVNDCAGTRALHIPFGANILLDAAVNIPANSQIILDGQLSKSPVAAGFTVPQWSMLQITGSNVSITGRGTIDGNLANQGGAHSVAGAGIVTTYAPGQVTPGAGVALYTNIYIAGITIQNTYNWPVSLAVANSLVESVYMTNANSSPQLVNSFNSHFLNCSAVNISDDGLGLYGGNTYCTVKGCYVSGCSTGPFILSDSANIGVTSLPNVSCGLLNNIAIGNTNAGCFISGLAAGGTGVDVIQLNCVIANNILQDNETAGDIDINSVDGLLVCGNTTKQTRYTGRTIGLSGHLNNVKVTGNIFGGHSTNAILQVYNDSATGNSGVVISDNTFTDTTAGDGGGVAMQFQCAGSSSYITVRDNDCFGSIVYAYQDLSATPAVNVEGTSSVNNSRNTKIITQSVSVQAAGVTGDAGYTSGITLAPSGNASLTGQLNAGVVSATTMQVGSGGLTISGGVGDTGSLGVTGTVVAGAVSATMMSGGGINAGGYVSAGSGVLTSGGMSAVGTVSGGGFSTSSTASVGQLAVNSGTVVFSGLPTSDPHHLGQVYLSGGTAMVLSLG
jgi:hypothetical protein